MRNRWNRSAVLPALVGATFSISAGVAGPFAQANTDTDVTAAPPAPFFVRPDGTVDPDLVPELLPVYDAVGQMLTTDLKPACTRILAVPPHPPQPVEQLAVETPPLQSSSDIPAGPVYGDDVDGFVNTAPTAVIVPCTDAAARPPADVE